MSQAKCPFCGGDGSAVLPGGPCQSCLRGLARRQRRATGGEYRILELIGAGATSEVYKARHLLTGEIVALKVARTRDLLDLFIRQARFESALPRKNIAGTRLGPERDGMPTLVMPFMSGGKLSLHEARHAPLDERLELALKIARALQSAHELGVLHCDLKADNILLDARGEPHLCDFGLARAVVPDAENIVIGGTPGWMAPEQQRALLDPTRAAKEPITTAADIFALGVLLHWLVAGNLPFGNGSDFARRVLEEPAPPLPPYTPDLTWGMLAIARRALEKAPGHDPHTDKRATAGPLRYLSVAALANDLERLRDHKPLVGIQVPAVGRVFRWAKRHPGARNTVLALLPCFAAAALVVVDRQRDNLRESVLAMNAYAASGQAAAVLYQLRDYAEEITRASHSPGIQSLVQPARPLVLDAAGAHPNPCQSQTRLADPGPLLPYAPHFSTLMAVDSSGCPRARVSEEDPPLEFIQHCLVCRSYFADARPDHHPGASVGVRKAYPSLVSKLIKFAVSTPLFDETSGDDPPRWIGVISGSLTVASTLELSRSRHTENSDQITAVLGPLEVDHTGPGTKQVPACPTPSSTSFTFLAHPKLTRGKKVTLPTELERAIDATLAKTPRKQFELPKEAAQKLRDYVDPLLYDRWLAALAPVGGTGFVVVVQTRESVAERPTVLLDRLARLLVVASGTLILAWGALLLWSFSGARRAEKLYPGPA